jgi:hypothetical protein
MTSRLYSLDDASRLLGCISIWTLRKHIAYGNVAVVRLGRRVFIGSEEIDRIHKEGLPSLRCDASSISNSEAVSNSNSPEDGRESQASATR